MTLLYNFTIPLYQITQYSLVIFTDQVTALSKKGYLKSPVNCGLFLLIGLNFELDYPIYNKDPLLTPGMFISTLIVY